MSNSNNFPVKAFVDRGGNNHVEMDNGTTDQQNILPTYPRGEHETSPQLSMVVAFSSCTIEELVPISDTEYSPDKEPTGHELSSEPSPLDADLGYVPSQKIPQGVGQPEGGPISKSSSLSTLSTESALLGATAGPSTLTDASTDVPSTSEFMAYGANVPFKDSFAWFREWYPELLSYSPYDPPLVTGRAFSLSQLDLIDELSLQNYREVSPMCVPILVGFWDEMGRIDLLLSTHCQVLERSLPNEEWITRRLQEFCPIWLILQRYCSALFPIPLCYSFSFFFLLKFTK